MTRAEFIAWLNEVERDLPVAEWRVHGIRVWPLVRLEIYASNFGGMIAREALAGGRWNNVRVLWNALWSWTRAVLLDWRANVRSDQPADAVFLAYSVGTQPVIGGKRYNPLLAPYVALLERAGKRSLVWEMSPYSQYNVPRYTPSFFVQPYLIRMRVGTYVWRRQHPPMAVGGHGEFVRRLKVAGLGSRYTQLGALGRDAYFIRRLAYGFAGWLRRVRPSHGFIADYGPREHAFCLACRELGITSVDIQHGLQGDLHPAYGSWVSVPPEGYELRPRVYWCWDDASAAAINRWAAQCDTAHTAVVGGDAWRELWLGTQNELVRQFDGDIARLKASAGGTVHILVTLDSLWDVIPSPLLNAMTRSPASWRYWVRLHPANQRARLPAAVNLLQQHGVSHVDVARVTELPLPALLRHVDLHVTVSWSTVILEAEAFGIPSVACNPKAAELFQDQVTRGTLRVPDSGAELLNAIREQLGQAPRQPAAAGGRPAAALARVLALRVRSAS